MHLILMVQLAFKVQCRRSTDSMMFQQKAFLQSNSLLLVQEASSQTKEFLQIVTHN